MGKILQLKKDYEREGFHLQRLYKRRIPDQYGIMKSTFSTIMESSVGKHDRRFEKPSVYEEDVTVYYSGGSASTTPEIYYDGGDSSQG